MKKIALTGGIASGKSTVAKFLEQAHISVIYADEVSNQELFANKSQIVEIFGKLILDNNGNLDKAKIKENIFRNQNKKQELEQFLHPKIKKNIDRQIAKINKCLVVVEVPLLFDAGWQDYFDQVWLVKTSFQKLRLLTRDDIDERLAENIIKNQTHNYNLADVVINNDGDIEELHQQISQLI